MKIYEKTSLIACDIEALFDFHIDFNNLKAITPKDTKVTLIGEIFTPKKGDILRLKTVKNFIPTTWEVEIREVQKPNLLLDVGLKSPFKHWVHSHIFTQRENGMCELKDIVEYELPFGIIGEAFDFFVRKEFAEMFSYRHEVTKNILENQDEVKNEDYGATGEI